MSETDNNPPRTRKPLGLKRSVEAGEVKQTFSHGRTNKVVVEVKRRKLIAATAASPAAARRRRAQAGHARAVRRNPAGTPGAPAARGRGSPPCRARGRDPARGRGTPARAR